MSLDHSTVRNFGTVPQIVRALAMANRHNMTPSEASEALRNGEMAQKILKSTSVLKAQVPGGTLADPEWAGQLADMPAASTAFLHSLGGRSAFALMLKNDTLTRAPLRTKVVVAGTSFTAHEVEEGQPTPVTRMTMNGGTLDPYKVQAVIVLDEDLIEDQSPASVAFVDRQLRRALARTLDQGFFDRLIGASESPLPVPSFAASGDVKTDVKTLLDAVNTGEGRLAWIAATDVANAAVVNDPRDATAPQGLTEFFGLPFAVSSALAEGTLALIDGDQVVAEIESLGVDVSRHGALEMVDNPTNESTTPTAAGLVSLWQNNMQAIRITARCGVKRGTNSALAVMTGVNWS